MECGLEHHLKMTNEIYYRLNMMNIKKEDFRLDYSKINYNTIEFNEIAYMILTFHLLVIKSITVLFLEILYFKKFSHRF